MRQLLFVCVVLALAGYCYVTGAFTGKAAFGSTNLTAKFIRDLFVAKVSPAGKVLWALSAGSSDVSRGAGIAVDSQGNSHVTGLFIGSATFGTTTLNSSGGADIFIAKVSPGGSLPLSTSMLSSSK